MDRRTLLLSSVAALGAAGFANAQSISSAPLPPAGGAPTEAPSGPAAPAHQPSYPVSPSDGAPASQAPATGQAATYTRDEIVTGVSDFLGVTAEAAGGAVEKLFARNGKPTAYIAGEEGSGAFVVGGRYGRRLLYMKDREPIEVFWQGPSLGWDWGGNASRVFTLVYDLQEPEDIYQRFPGVEGSAYLIGGLGVNYQKAGGVTLAPIRAGVGLRLGANVGYLAYTKKRNIIPF
jgi:hypothetical protein